MLNKLFDSWGLTACVAGLLVGLFVGYTVTVSQAETAIANLPAEEETVAPTPTPDEQTAPTYLEIEIEATAYCCENYPHICNDGDATTTATGTTPTAGRTIAVDPQVIPYGAEVIINGNTFVAEDCGGAIKGNRIDILFETHEEALQFGRQKLTAYVRA